MILPYIRKNDRERLVPLDTLDTPKTPGELNFLLSDVCKTYLEENGESYSTYNDLLGALEGAKLELYRRRVAPYEDEKIKANGDVW
jgi:hypothetical protein